MVTPSLQVQVQLQQIERTSHLMINTEWFMKCDKYFFLILL
jgi:hypothetical protein